jgi:hypothetical protein
VILTKFLYVCIDNHRYFQNRGSILKNLFPLSILEQWPIDTFKKKLQMTSLAFHYILHMTSQHSIFICNSKNEQASIQLQLAIALYCFGRLGNGAF